MTTKAEQETIVNWDQQEQVAHLYTAYEAQAKRWRTLGYDVRVFDRDQQGRATGWGATAEVDAVRFRRVRDGKVVRRQGHRKGRRFGAVQHDQLVALETPISETDAWGH